MQQMLKEDQLVAEILRHADVQILVYSMGSAYIPKDRAEAVATHYASFYSRTESLSECISRVVFTQLFMYIHIKCPHGAIQALVDPSGRLGYVYIEWVGKPLKRDFLSEEEKTLLMSDSRIGGLVATFVKDL